MNCTTLAVTGTAATQVCTAASSAGSLDEACCCSRSTVSAKGGMFCRPKAGSATRHLFVGNCGPAVGLTKNQVQHYFECTGAEAVTIPAPAEAASSHVFVTYKTVAAAEVVLKVLSAKPAAELGNRKLVVKYAAKKLDQQADKVRKSPNSTCHYFVYF